MKNKRLIAAVAALVVCVAVALGIWLMNRPETAAGAKAYTVTVVHADGSVREFSYRTDAEYLDDALVTEGLISGEDGPYGLTVITVDGEDAVWDTDNAYWAVYIGEEMATTGVSEIPVYDGSVFKLEYTSLG